MFKCHISNFNTPGDNLRYVFPAKPVIMVKPELVKYENKDPMETLKLMSLSGQELKWSSLAQLRVKKSETTNLQIRNKNM